MAVVHLYGNVVGIVEVQRVAGLNVRDHFVDIREAEGGADRDRLSFDAAEDHDLAFRFSGGHRNVDTLQIQILTCRHFLKLDPRAVAFRELLFPGRIDAVRVFVIFFDRFTRCMDGFHHTVEDQPVALRDA